MSKPVKLTIAGLAVATLAGVAGVAATKNKNKATEVKIEAVARRDLVASVTASGQVSPHTKVDVSADVTGRIVRLAVKEGDIVTKGQFLLQIDPVQAEAQVQRSVAAVSAARAQEAQAKASWLQAQMVYNRQQELKKLQPQLVSDEQLDQLRTQVEVNRALYEAGSQQVQQAVAGLRDARRALERTTILAPMSGKITRLTVEEGEVAVPGTFNKELGTLLTISDMNVLETKIKVDETDVARIEVGDSAVVQIDAFPDTTFVGRVTEISNSSLKAASAGGQASDQAIDYEVTVQLVNPPKDTRPDFSATAKVVTDTRTKAISVPIIALTVRENEALAQGDTVPARGGRQPAKQVGKQDVEGVFIVGVDNKVAFRPVKVGIAGEKYFEVLSGVKDGEKIVAGTYQAIRELKDGNLVKAAAPAGKDGKGAAKGGSKS
ncbi:MAG TPA: efflux RND transporter periplasmic adaptor subunit [Gemmatirosa sp.]|nr:efflux RND transporter periplasmic adaptor subunit [Gemmatirosa sp.]